MGLNTCPSCGNVHDYGWDSPPVVDGCKMCFSCFKEEIYFKDKPYYKGYVPMSCTGFSDYYLSFNNPEELLKKMADSKRGIDGYILTKGKSTIYYQRLLFADRYVAGGIHNYDLKDINIPACDEKIYTHGIASRKKAFDWCRGRIVVEKNNIYTTDEELTALVEQCPVDVYSLIEEIAQKIPFNKGGAKCIHCGTEITRANLYALIPSHNCAYDKLICNNKSCIVETYVCELDRDR